MKRALLYTLAAAVALCTAAGPHTVQRGETFADIARLYNIPLDTLLKANPDTEAFTGLTIEVPLQDLVYDLGDSQLFRQLRYGNNFNTKKGAKKFKAGNNKQLKIPKLYKKSDKDLKKAENAITKDYEEAIAYGNFDALCHLGVCLTHGNFLDYSIWPSFNKAINADNIDEFQKGIEYLQIAALLGHDKYALTELAVACGHEKSPIRNPYLCLSMLEQIDKSGKLRTFDVKNLICHMYETGYGIQQNLKQAYIYCPKSQLVSSRGEPTQREKILEKIEKLPASTESARYGVGMDTKTMLSIALSHFHDSIMEPEGFYWLHRAARMNSGDANWIMAGILHNKNFRETDVDYSFYGEEPVMHFAKKAASLGKQEATDFLEAHERYEQALAERERQRRIQEQIAKEEKKRRRREMWLNVAGTVLNTAAQTYVAVQTAKSYNNHANVNYAAARVPAIQMSDAQWQARNQLALQQIAQYTYNKTMADWNGTPMVPTDMSAVDLGTDMSPGSPLWSWGMQQQINTLATQNARMRYEENAFYKRQADMITQQLMENPLQPIAGYVDRDGNWISREMVEADKYSNTTENHNADEPESRRKSYHTDYYTERYGYKDCPSCRGSGICKWCNGKRYVDNEFGLSGSHECPNCEIEHGHRSGKCSTCHGTGRVYGLK